VAFIPYGLASLWRLMAAASGCRLQIAIATTAQSTVGVGKLTINERLDFIY